MARTYSKCTDCERMDYIVDGGTVCESCLRHSTSAKVLLSQADTEIANLRTALAAAERERDRLRSRLHCSTFPLPNEQQLVDALAERDSAKAEVERLRGMLTSIYTLVDFPDLHVGDMRLGLHCGVEDRNLRDRYDGADYGWEDAAERCAEWAKNMSALTPAPPQAKANSIYDNNPKCERCGDTPSAGDGAWRIRDGMKWDHRCSDIHPQCGYEPCPPGYLPDPKTPSDAGTNGGGE